MPPVMNDVTLPAILHPNLPSFSGSEGVAFAQTLEYVFIGVRNRRTVAAGAVAALDGWMVITGNIPGSNSMTLPTLPPEEPPVGIQMAIRTRQIGMQQGVIHAGDIPSGTAMLGVAFRTVLPCKMKPQSGAQGVVVIERVTFQAGF